MKKNYGKIILMAVAVVLMLLALLTRCDFGGNTKVKKIVEVDTVGKNTVVADDGQYVYYTDKDGNLKCVDPYDIENPTTFIEGMSLLAMGKTHILVSYNDGITIVNKEEKGIEETYNVETNNAQFTGDSVYYLDKSSGCIMKINRATKEESTLVSTKIKKFLITDNRLVYVPQEKKAGIVVFDMTNGMASLYAQNRTVGDFYVTADGTLYYVDESDGNALKFIRFIDGVDGVIEGKKFSNFAVCRGVYFYTHKSNLMADLEGLY